MSLFELKVIIHNSIQNYWKSFNIFLPIYVFLLGKLLNFVKVVENVIYWKDAQLGLVLLHQRASAQTECGRAAQCRAEVLEAELWEVWRLLLVFLSYTVQWALVLRRCQFYALARELCVKVPSVCVRLHLRFERRSHLNDKIGELLKNN